MTTPVPVTVPEPMLTQITTLLGDHPGFTHVHLTGTGEPGPDHHVRVELATITNHTVQTTVPVGTVTCLNPWWMVWATYTQTEGTPFVPDASIYVDADSRVIFGTPTPGTPAEVHVSVSVLHPAADTVQAGVRITAPGLTAAVDMVWSPTGTVWLGDRG